MRGGPPRRRLTVGTTRAEKDQRRQEKKLRRGFGGLAALGAILALGGLVGLVHTGVATLTSMLLFGRLLLICGIVGLLHAVESRGSNFFWPAVVVAALNIAAGAVVIRHPETAAEGLTMFAALLFLPAGSSGWWAVWSCAARSSAGPWCRAPSACCWASCCSPTGRTAAATSSARSSPWRCSSTVWA